MIGQGSHHPSCADSSTSPRADPTPNEVSNAIRNLGSWYGIVSSPAADLASDPISRRFDRGFRPRVPTPASTRPAALPPSRRRVAGVAIGELTTRDDVRLCNDRRRFGHRQRAHETAAPRESCRVPAAKSFFWDAIARRGGQVLIEMAERGERRTAVDGLSEQVSRDGTPAPSLDALGISRNRSSRWQAVAQP
jgi:hypothetical protein